MDALASDPAKGGKISSGSRIEAMTGLEAESKGFIPGPIKRGPAEIEFYDADGNPWDVKAPPSKSLDMPKSGQTRFRTDEVGKSIKKQLSKEFRNEITAQDKPVGVLLNTSYLIDEDRQELESWLEDNLDDVQKSRLRKVATE